MLVRMHQEMCSISCCGIVDGLLFLPKLVVPRSNMKFLRCGCACVDDLYLRQGPLLKTEEVGACRAMRNGVFVERYIARSLVELSV